MQAETVDIFTLHQDPANARRHPDRNLDAIKASLARFGQQKPIVVDADGIVRAGNGTLEAAKALGWQEIAIVRTPLKGSEATAYAIADNRTGELAEWDETALAETLRALDSEQFDVASLGFNEEDMPDMEAEIETARVVESKISSRKLPRMAWVLIGVPIDHYARVDKAVRSLAAMEGVVCETTVSDVNVKD